MDVDGVCNRGLIAIFGDELETICKGDLEIGVVV